MGVVFGVLALFGEEDVAMREEEEEGANGAPSPSIFLLVYLYY